MQEVNSLCTDSRALLANYCIVAFHTIQPSSSTLGDHPVQSSATCEKWRGTGTGTFLCFYRCMFYVSSWLHLLRTEVHRCAFVARSSFHNVSHPAACDATWPKRILPGSATTCAASTCLPVRRRQVSSWRVSDDQAPAGTCPEVSRKLYRWVIQAYLEFLTSVIMMMM